MPLTKSVFSMKQEAGVGEQTPGGGRAPMTSFTVPVGTFSPLSLFLCASSLRGNKNLGVAGRRRARGRRGKQKVKQLNIDVASSLRLRQQVRFMCRVPGTTAVAKDCDERQWMGWF